ncbi:hypothetical protein LVJ82_13985 [Vitreoscilla massiliensis]|uniref:DUF3108 domain-containing protein n=1 Tax=Vitreoscilla massiliensis TaxID=1689272 RepID=A0ABY4DZM8_9NEIS|nr:hypothetical protein [Vitreoscilla massiliensis]UOO88566.1 hypothetical protein LVJ82_13985 [Vitreoscilla massiliensis]
MKTFLGILLACSVPVSAWATSCGTRLLYNLHTQTQNVYPDSVFWLEISSRPQTEQLDVHNMQFQRLGQRGIGYQPVTNYLNGIAQLRPKKPLQVGLKYTFTSKTPLEKLQYEWQKGVIETVDLEWVEAAQRVNSFTVLPAVSLPLPAWVQYPKLHEVSQGETTVGDAGRISWKMQANLNVRDYLVYVNLSRKADFSEAQGFLTDVGYGQTVNVSFDPCQTRKERFDFKYGDTIWAKFDLISHNGIIVPWQGEPLRFELQPLEPARQ